MEFCSGRLEECPAVPDALRLPESPEDAALRMEARFPALARGGSREEATQDGEFAPGFVIALVGGVLVVVAILAAMLVTRERRQRERQAKSAPAVPRLLYADPTESRKDDKGYAFPLGVLCAACHKTLTLPAGGDVRVKDLRSTVGPCNCGVDKGHFLIYDEASKDTWQLLQSLGGVEVVPDAGAWEDGVKQLHGLDVKRSSSLPANMTK